MTAGNEKKYVYEYYLKYDFSGRAYRKEKTKEIVKQKFWQKQRTEFVY